MQYTILSPGEIEYTFTCKKKHLATKFNVHGGVISAYMDAIIGVAALSAVYQEHKLVATIEFKINFLAPAFENDVLKGLGKVITKGKSILVCEGKIFNSANQLIAIGIGTLKSYTYTP